MRVLILDRHNLGAMLANAWKKILSDRYGHDVDYEMFLRECNTPLSEYSAVIAHPIKEDFKPLYDEANNRKDFRLIFFNTKTLENINPSDEFKNNNVFFEQFPKVSYLDKLIRS